MFPKAVFCVLCTQSLLSTIETQRGDLNNFLSVVDSFRLLFQRTLLVKRRVQTDKFQETVPDSVPFPCSTTNTRSRNKPESVNELRPGDIDVIGAIGDSLTGGFGISASTLPEVFLEERGKAFSIGGEKNWRSYLTLPNILKEFNPNLVGYSLNTSLSIEFGSQLNVAEGGTTSSNTPYMAKVLINRIRKDPRISVDDDWKMITIFIGSNDFCLEVCYLDDPYSSLLHHQNDLRLALRILRDNLPRTIVNLVVVPHLRILVNLRVSPLCDISHIIECPCLFGLPNQGKRQILYDIMSKWQEIDMQFGKDPEFDRNDFTVVVLPFTLNYTFPTIYENVADYSFMSVDCFHFSQKMNAKVANDLWNNLLEPAGSKSTDGNALFKKFLCPNAESPYIYTRRNSITQH